MIDINLSKVCKSYGFNNVLNNIDLTINFGDKVGLIGSNGSGKSTILKLITGIENVNSGTISVRKNTKIGYLSQIPEVCDVKVIDYINSSFKEILNVKEQLEKYEQELINGNLKTIIIHQKVLTMKNMVKLNMVGQNTLNQINLVL